MKNRIEDDLRKLVIPVLDELGYQLVDIEYKKEGIDWYLRFFIDKESGVTIDDCEAASRKISNLLDEADPIENSYIMEVSSPGIDRPLKNQSDYDRAKGKQIEIHLYKPFNGSKVYKGILVGLTNGIIEIISQDKHLQFKKEDISLVKPVVVF